MTKKLPKVSVIVPAYNVEKYLKRCLNSISNQTMADFECIVVNDGSTDRTGEIADSFAAQDSRFRVFHNNNMGLSSTRNYGYKETCGEWISFIDGDDWVSDDFIERLYKSAIDNNADIAFCDWYFAYNKKNTICRCFSPGKDKEETLSRLIMEGYHVVWNKIYKKSFLEEHRLMFPEHIQIFNEDTWFSFRAFFYTESITKINSPLYYYNRENSGAITKRYQTEHAQLIRNMVYEDALNFFSEKGVLDTYKRPVLWRVLQEKTSMVFSPETYGNFNDTFPEANKYILSNPLLGWKMKILMWLLAHGFSGTVTMLIHFGKRPS